MARISTDLQWQIIRNNSCFLHRQRGIQKTFSKDPLNLKKVNSQRYNGLVHKKALGIVPAKDGKGVVLMYKKARNQNKPRDSVEKITLRKDGRRTLNTIGKFIEKGNYRRALKKMAMRRASHLMKGQRPVAPRKGGRRNKKKNA